MSEISLDMRQIYSLTEFLRNYKVHLAHLKETKTPEVLTIKGRAEFVVLDADTYQGLVDRIKSAEEIAYVRSIFARSNGYRPTTSQEELDRRNLVLDELVAETEKLGLYK
jgi:hypothetical protein